jgi:nucleoside 2-deoxyribosyltransferase
MYGIWSGQQPVMTAAADYLGLSLTLLRTQLHSGTSLAGIATAQGKPVSGLKDAILAAMTSRINANTALTAQQRRP